VSLLLDTGILLRWFEDERALRPSHRRAVQGAKTGEALLVSDISLWEIATLSELGRIRLRLPLRDWLEHATAPPLVSRCAITPAIAAEVAALPSSFHRDPADRIIVATCRNMEAPIVTRDRLILRSRLVSRWRPDTRA
jgi:PIN domain nuclease of toxin-antitoxin system